MVVIASAKFIILEFPEENSNDMPGHNKWVRHGFKMMERMDEACLSPQLEALIDDKSVLKVIFDPSGSDYMMLNRPVEPLIDLIEMMEVCVCACVCACAQRGLKGGFVSFLWIFFCLLLLLLLVFLE